ncbi:TRAP transporter large permease [Nocardia jinanensis]|uniref:C4-dicarboxylate ABC transporter n=1 Tax=Nocardia jinanensis TaxID=382504 RepID=A0A917RP12_9NOCA|nr:TRAP transporter large permease [Nocardia jinanensis]GGL16134.1 C4-dicarboxylate ABC transporter [Nocardia jinanensis]
MADSAVTASPSVIPAREGTAADTGPGPSARRANRVMILVAVATAVTSAALGLVEMPDPVVGLVVILATILLMLAGVPVGIAILAAGGAGLWKLAGFDAMAVTFEDVPFATTASWSLSVIPLFIFMGIALGKFNLTTKLFDAAQQWMGKLPGGLAIATNFAGAGLAAASGSSIAISYALGRITIPEMLRANYKPSLAVGVVAMAGTLGMLIPPSVVLVVYAGAAGTAIGPQLLAALVPGLVLAVAFAVLILVRSALDPTLAPRIESSDITWRSRLGSLPGITPLALIIAVIIGGMYTGFFTPTEAGAFGALLAVLLGWLFGGGDRNLRRLGTTLVACLRETVAGVASIFLLLIGVHVLTRTVALSGLADLMADTVTGMGLSRIAFLFVLIIVFLILGMFMDSLAMILLTVPVLMPVLSALDIDMIWYGVFMVILVEIGLVTPPIGMLSYIVHRLTQHPEVNLGRTVHLSDVFKGTAWFIIAGLAVLTALIFWPDLALWLPGQSNAG